VAQKKTAVGVAAQRPPHPATVAQKKTAVGVAAQRPPHPATVPSGALSAQPKAADAGPDRRQSASTGGPDQAAAPPAGERDEAAEPFGTVQMWSLWGVARGLTGLATTAAIGALIASVGSVAAVTGAVTAGTLYLALKVAGFGPYLGGQNNVEALSAGKGSRHTLGVGLVNKSHWVAHSVVVIDGFTGEQTVGEVPEGVIGTLRPLIGVDTKTEFGLWEGEEAFDPVRGRVATVHITLDGVGGALTQLNIKTRLSVIDKTLGKYNYFTNSCTSHVIDICRAAGLSPPPWASTPTLLWYWMRLMAAIQAIV